MPVPNNGTTSPLLTTRIADSDKFEQNKKTFFGGKELAFKLFLQF